MEAPFRIFLAEEGTPKTIHIPFRGQDPFAYIPYHINMRLKLGIQWHVYKYKVSQQLRLSYLNLRPVPVKLHLHYIYRWLSLFYCYYYYFTMLFTWQVTFNVPLLVFCNKKTIKKYIYITNVFHIINFHLLCTAAFARVVMGHIRSQQSPAVVVWQ